MARPARLDRAIWLNTPSSPISEAVEAATLAGSVWARVLIAGAASVQPWGTDMLPTRAALPIDPDTGAPPTDELSIGATAAPRVSGARAPEIDFGPARYAPAPCPFWPHAYAWPNARNGPPGMVLDDWGENTPVTADQNVFQLLMIGGAVKPVDGAAVDAVAACWPPASV